MTHASDPQDLACIRRMQRGDATALAELFDRYAGLMHPVALRILRSPDMADDAVQQAWMQAWRQADRFREGRGSVAGWLVMLVRSRALDLHRRRGSRSRAESQRAETTPPTASPDPTVRAEATSAQARVREALDRLDPRMRNVIERAFFGGQTQREIAESQDLPLGTVKTWTRRGMDALRKLLRKGGDA